ncbi:MAG: sigma-54-dependent Fis family transcriptional regulator [Deltaproteobacteria bacterium]|nr:MAG: sigma-54-dependent Fis family transcriptional regulator [Deltaproteobacteria bacterium]
MERANQVLVIDDDEAAREILVELLGRVGYHAFAAPEGRSGLEWLAGAAVPPQAVLLDLRMPGIDGFEVLRRYRTQGGLAPVIALSAMDDKESVVKAMRLGASDYLVKPIEPDELREAIERCSASVRAPGADEVPAVLPPRPDPVPAVVVVRESGAPPPVAPTAGSRRGPPIDFVSVSPAMMGIWDMVDRVAETDVPVLIRGESGVGKEGIARALHERSPRRGKPFVKINCAALPSELLESELFGHERGAFTGATSEKPGKFELADKGTIFLDEIGEMHPALQAKLLQVLQDEEYYRVGGKRPLRADARVVVATNRVLEEEIARGNFREDLYYRLNVVSVHVPPLRDRKEDVPHLIEHFRRKYGSKYKQGAMEFSPDVTRRLLEYDYPGNVRELENLVRRLVVLRDERFVLDELRATQARRPALQPTLQAGSAGGALPPANQGHPRYDAPPSQPPAPVVPMLGSAETVSLKEIARQAALRAEREAISAMLARTNWNKRKAAARLQISYKALLYKIKDCGLTDPRITASIPDLPPVGLAAANDPLRSSS